jgi:hypothetical protein
LPSRLTFSDGKSVYVSGDTSTTEQMPLLAEKNIDYASFVVMEFITWDLAKLRNVQDWLRQSIIFPTM